MPGFIARQPNGLLCRHSTVTDCVTHYNMTEKEYIAFCRRRAEKEARDTIEKRLRPFREVEESFAPNNMTKEEFKKILRRMRHPAAECHPEIT